jgi:hypothetical protein
VLDEKQVMIKSITDARKEKIDAEASWKLFQSASSITIAKGRKVQIFNPSSDDKANILKQAMGPSKNLRAPALRVKDSFVIGFNKELYDQVF